MIRSLKKRFIAIAMLAFFAVLIVALVAVNCVNRYNVYRGIEQRLVYLAESDLGPPRGMLAELPISIQEWMDMEGSDLMSVESYFIFSGGMMDSMRDHELRTLSEAAGLDAGAKLEELLAGGKDFGNFGNYRYYVAERGALYHVVFLRCGNEFSAMRSLLKTSIAVGLVCTLAVLALVTLLSGLVTRPFAENVERQKRFISDVSHELKTPLGVIMADLDMQVMDHGSTEWLENAQTQTDHMAMLIDRLVSRSLMDERMHRAEAVMINLSLLTTDSLHELEPMARMGDLTVTADIAPGVVVHGNEAALREVLSILLDNAVKYTPPGGQISLCLSRGRKTVLEIGNDCQGLQNTDLERLFDRFYRADATRASQEGHGLGLSIARDLMSQFGGTIRVRMEAGDRILFTVEL